jgi:hypothetical protein
MVGRPVAIKIMHVTVTYRFITLLLSERFDNDFIHDCLGSVIRMSEYSTVQYYKEI